MFVKIEGDIHINFDHVLWIEEGQDKDGAPTVALAFVTRKGGEGTGPYFRNFTGNQARQIRRFLSTYSESKDMGRH